MVWAPVIDPGPAIGCVGYKRTEHETDFRGWGAPGKRSVPESKSKTHGIGSQNSDAQFVWFCGLAPRYRYHVPCFGFIAHLRCGDLRQR